MIKKTALMVIAIMIVFLMTACDEESNQSLGEAFIQHSVTGNINRLNDISDSVFAAGASSWADTAESGVTVWLDPYTDAQIDIFNDFLLENGFDPAFFNIRQAVTQEMLDSRADYITTAAASPGNLIIPVGEMEISRAEIAFSLENTTDVDFNYGAPWDLARFEDGEWRPVPHLPGAGNGLWTQLLYTLQSGGIEQYRQNFEWHFGALPPGRYMYIRDGYLGDWNPNQESVYALVEFEITEATPMELDS